MSTVDITDEKLAPPARLLSREVVLTRLSCSDPTLRKLMRANRFPRPRRVIGKPMWIEAEVEAWIQNLPVKLYKSDK